MLEAIVTVTRVEGSVAWVEGQAQSACSHCGSSAHCGTSTVSKLFGPRRQVMQVENVLDAQVGDRVVIGISDALVSRASLGAYMLPMLSMAIPAAVGDKLGFGDGMVATLALIGFFAGLVVVGHLSSRSGARYRPTMLRVERPGFSVSQFNQGAIS
ncbi:SoxR reducing system RseC family protein [Thiosocius teredinicola]|uniref:SoxR reducing system RseC family protein n=1 Tax=Thiosocius teredinicola TaxID=1973002 RepID=UPI0009914786